MRQLWCLRVARIAGVLAALGAGACKESARPDAGGGSGGAGGSTHDGSAGTDTLQPADSGQPGDGALPSDSGPSDSGQPGDAALPSDSGPSDSGQPGDAAVVDADAGSDAPADGGVPLARITVIADSVLSANATAIKSYDTNVNIASYRQHGLLYHAGYQYVAWFNGNARNAIIARRTLNPDTMAAGAWQWAYANFVLASGGDSHNVISMGISRGDGRLHVAFGQHGAQLYSIRSVAGAVSGAVWDNSVFGGTGNSASTAAAPSSGMPGLSASTTTVTYPYFMNAADADQTLQFAYRTGSSGNGEMQLAEYNAATGQWSHLGQVTSATGSYTQGGVTSTTRNAYPHGFNYDERGRLHMAFTWRENLSTVFIAGCSDTITNHDTLYVYSDDRGRTWKNSAGTQIATSGASSLVALNSPGTVVDPLPVGRDLMNQETQTTDHASLFHAVISYVPGRYQATCATDRSQAQPFHLWRAADGSWTKTEIRLGGQDVNQGYDRAKIFVDSGDNVYVVLPDLRVVGASRSSAWTDWKLLYDGRSLGNYGETIIDHTLTRTADAVSILYLADTSDTVGALHVLDLKLSR